MTAAVAAAVHVATSSAVSETPPTPGVDESPEGILELLPWDYNKENAENS